MIQIKRAYEPPAPDDGARYLVDSLWPRGVRKEALQIDGWLRAVAPSQGLRKWFSHDPAKWEEFQKRYFAKSNVTLLYGARDTEHNNARALKEYLEEHISSR